MLKSLLEAGLGTERSTVNSSAKLNRDHPLVIVKTEKAPRGTGAQLSPPITFHTVGVEVCKDNDAQNRRH